MVKNTVRRNFTIKKEADQILDEKSEEWGMSRSELVSKAVLAYTNEDQLSRIEDKVDSIGNMIHEEMASEDDETASDEPTDRRERVYNLIDRESDGYDNLPELDHILDLCVDELGIDREKAEQDIEKLKHQARAYNPNPGHIDTV